MTSYGNDGYTTEQEKFWAGGFGDDYVRRNQGEHLLASNLNLFGSALGKIQKITSCIEFGANIGMNLRALQILFPGLVAHGIEINKSAAGILSGLIGNENVYNQSILEFDPMLKWDLVLVKGVLIHINPSQIEDVYRKLIKAAGRYMLIAEYYSPTPVSISYRGHEDRLFKRDFAGEILDMDKSLSLIDYGFAYHRDNNFPQDDINWFLLEKN